ncbi:sulfatase-like hydrolase/transferase [Thalassoglobus polymorphus]|uniref:Arylsulfatase n=1 Tax=Thalassoglobus polymorphus TaxID=2527994 RepID=A0A517QTV4_9PLAN|nr:sulfatase-like hydrolase/transferase [Thalassoglobus polymorphus]QDT35061.1 Arylsulfatase [Thalassoglobus polymorphus]
MRWLFVVTFLFQMPFVSAYAEKRPNILIAISDDQSWPHTSAYGSKFVKTPAFDRVAKEGVLFNNAYAASPGCSPSRAALLTGKHHWQIEHAGTHASLFPRKYQTFPEVLGENGYFVGLTGKGWGPGDFETAGWKQNPAGPSFDQKKTKPPFKKISGKDYAANFAEFLSEKPEDQPFCFWYGAHEPHRAFQQGSGLKAGKKLEDVEVPAFLPDRPEIRSDLLDYAVEIEWFDQHLGKILDQLEEAGELENTLVIVTSDNGMAFPRAKANCYEYGVHVPLAIRWGSEIAAGRTSDDLVGFVDLTATIYDATEVAPPDEESSLPGKSLVNILKSEKEGTVDSTRTAVFSGRERHSSSRYLNLAYPQRSMRTKQHLYIRNFRPDRWPAGSPRKLDENGGLGPQDGGYHDIDACPSLSYFIENKTDPEIVKYFDWATQKRPAVEIFDMEKDPACLNNLAGTEGFAETEKQLAQQFEDYLIKTKDPRILDGGDVFETYHRVSAIRQFPAPSHVEYYDTAMRKEGWIPLFNRRNLDGWKASTPSDSFEVVNGMIKAQATSDQSHLFYTGEVNDADFQDFELLVYVMTTPGSNSGIYFHTEYQEEGFPEVGHEVQVNSTHKNPNKTGSLFTVKDVTETDVTDNVFYTELITVKGNRVTIKVNDKTVVTYTEPSNYKHPKFSGRKIDHGTFALQAHDPDSTVYFREIWVRPLDDKKTDDQ